MNRTTICCLFAPFVFVQCRGASSPHDSFNSMTGEAESFLGLRQKDVPVIPYPQHVKLLEGDYRITNCSPRIVLNEGVSDAMSAVEALRLFIQGSSALTATLPMLASDTAAAPRTDERTGSEELGCPEITLTLTNTHQHNAEEYELIAEAGKPIQFNAPSSAGLFYGVQTFIQLAKYEASSGDLVLPAVHIKDFPRFQWRGMHLDVSRHFFPPHQVKRVLDVLAHLKYNKFHWHLTDDQGWRFTVDKWPRLTQIGSGLEAEKVTHQAWSGNAARPDKPYYTIAEMKDIVKYAERRHIEVIPEVDVPGHVVSALAAYPELGNDDIELYQPPTSPPVERFLGQKVWGVYHQTLQPSIKSLNFINDVYNTLVEVFPSKFVHIGGDEAPQEEWMQSNRAQALGKEPGHYQSYFTEHIAQMLSKKGRTPVAWDEVLQTGGAPDNMIITAWRSPDELQRSVRLGHPTINAVSEYLYFDHAQATSGEPTSICCYLPLQKVYSYDPAGGLQDNEKALVLGAQAELWSEYFPNSKRLEYMAHPRSFALAEVLWSPSSWREREDSFQNFESRLATRLPDLDKFHIHYRRPEELRDT